MASRDAKGRHPLFVVDAGPEVGLGHLQRCLGLAAALRRGGARACFASQPRETVRERVEAARFTLFPLDSGPRWDDEGLTALLTLTRFHDIDILVVDCYGVMPTALNRLRAAGLLVVAVDDLALHPFPCQLVVNGNAGAEELEYRSVLGDTHFLLGPRYSILSPEFWAMPVRRVEGTVRNVLITLGGSDPYGLMPRFIDLLEEIPGEFTVTGVLGPFFKNKTDVKERARRSKRHVVLIESPSSFGGVMKEADLALSGAGQTLYELARVGCPTVAVQIAENQQPQLRALAKAGVVHAVPQGNSANGLEATYNALVELIMNVEKRAEMSAAGQRLIDGKGAVRVAEVILTG